MVLWPSQIWIFFFCCGTAAVLTTGHCEVLTWSEVHGTLLMLLEHKSPPHQIWTWTLKTINRPCQDPAWVPTQYDVHKYRKDRPKNRQKEMAKSQLFSLVRLPLIQNENSVTCFCSWVECSKHSICISIDYISFVSYENMQSLRSSQRRYNRFRLFRCQ